VAALWYWGYAINGQEDGYIPPWWILLAVWPLAFMSFFFAYLMQYGLPGLLSLVNPSVLTDVSSCRILSSNTAQSAQLLQDFVQA